MNFWFTMVLVLLFQFSCDRIVILGFLVQKRDIPEKSCSGCAIFPPPATNSSLSDVPGFTTITNLQNRTAVVGARNNLFMFDLHGKFKGVVNVSTIEKSYKDCKDRNLGQTKLCVNDINLVMVEDSGMIVTCGTNSNDPHCWKINGTKIQETFTPGLYYPRTDLQYVNTGSILFTSYRERGRGRLFKVDLNTRYNYLDRKFAYITNPRFVSMYVFGNFIYYFFTELPEEIDISNKVVYSRVGRLCKYDVGGIEGSFYEDRIALFSKARLLCGKNLGSTESPTHYNILEHTSFVRSKDGDTYIYGVFKTSDPDIPVSVLCRYRLSDLEKLFSTSKYYTNELDGLHPPQKREANDPRFKCGLSNETKRLDKKSSIMAFHSTIASEEVKPEGDRPVVELHDTQITHITAEAVTTSNGEDSYHVINLFDSNTMLDVVVPATLHGEPHVLSRRKICKDPLKISNVKKLKDKIFVAAAKKVAIVPKVSCHLYKSCRDCVAARNPHCGWNNKWKNCSYYDPSESSVYIQNIQDGDYSSVCDKEKASCELRVERTAIPFQEVVLTCQVFGVPAPNVTRWTKDGVLINLGSANIERKGINQGEQLSIESFNLTYAGNYSCHVDNNLTSGSCSVTLPGSSPQLKCGISQRGTRSVECNATGYPEPNILFKVIDESDRSEKSVFGKSIRITVRKSYQGLAFNPFGAVSGQVYRMASKFMKLKIGKVWTPAYANKGSEQYKQLESFFKNEVEKLYRRNLNFESITNVTFSEGSVVVSFVLNGLVSSSSEENELSRPLREAINKKELGSLTVEEYKDDSRLEIRTPKPDTEYRSSSSGVAVWLVVILVLLFCILLFLLGFWFGMRQQHVLKCTNQCHRQTSCSEEEDEQMEELSRSRVGGESRNRLLHNNSSKQASSSRKQNICISNDATDNKRSSGISKHGSIEIEKTNNHGEEEGFLGNDQSVC